MPDPLEDSLLHLDDEPGTPPTPPAEPGKEGTPAPTKDDKRLTDLEESNKNLQEKMRQQTEENKTLRDFRDNIVKATGKGTEDDKEKAQQELVEFDKNPVPFMRKMMKEEMAEAMAGVKDAVAMNKSSFVVDKVINDIDAKYDVDWDKNHQKINAQLKSFSQEAKDSDPQGTLLKACQLAGCLKSRDVSSPTTVEEKTRAGVCGCLQPLTV